jgi:hypothetical protein
MNIMDGIEYIETSQFVVEFHGDPSVGIRNIQWTIDGCFEFEDQDDLDAFKKKIAQAFEIISPTPITVMSVEEWETQM